MIRDLDKLKFTCYDVFNMNYAEGIARMILVTELEKLQQEDPEAYKMSSAPIVALIFKNLASENLMHMQALLKLAKGETVVDKVNEMTKH